MTGTVVGGTYLGRVLAGDAVEALERGTALASVSLCHACSSALGGDLEIEHVTVTCGDESATDEPPDDWQAKALAAGWMPPCADETVTLADPLAALRLSLRAERALLGTGVATVGALTDLTWVQLRKIRGFGKGLLRDVRDALARHGLALAGEGGRCGARGRARAASPSPAPMVARRHGRGRCPTPPA